MSRRHFTPTDSVQHLWNALELPDIALAAALELKGDGLGLPSSFKIGHIAQASIGLSALTAALLYSHRHNVALPRVTVELQQAITEFKAERLYLVSGQRPHATGQTIGGLHKTSDGHVRVHDTLSNHREATKRLLASDSDERAAIAEKIAPWAAIDLETVGSDSGMACAALRSFSQWDVTPQARAVADVPIVIRKLCDGSPRLYFNDHDGAQDKCLQGLRVVDMTRIIAAPVAGRTLAAHGADVIWVTSPSLADVPVLDRDTARGKRTVSLDLDQAEDKATLDRLLEDADVFLQSYRPNSLARKDLGERVARMSKHGIVCANLSAYGTEGPWSQRRGFDSLVQTCSGMQVSEAEHFGAGEVARMTPVQVLDHASGYFMAAGINAALYKQATEGGSYEVSVSLAGTMKYLRSLGQYEGRSGFDCADFNSPAEVPQDRFEEKESEFGVLRYVKHAARIEGVSVGWEVMPKPLGSDEAVWNEQ